MGKNQRAKKLDTDLLREWELHFPNKSPNFVANVAWESYKRIHLPLKFNLFSKKRRK